MRASGSNTLCFLLFLFSLVVHAQTPKYSNEFLNLGVGARAFGMGLSTVAHVKDVTSGYWNPAGLNHLETDRQLSLMHSAYFAGIANYDYGAFALKMNEQGALSFSVLRFSVDDIADTRFLIDPTGAINYDNIRYFSSSDYAFVLSYARPVSMLGGLAVGGSVKVIRRVVGEFADSWGFGIDLGVRKDLGETQFGLVAKDLFGTFNSWSYHTSELDDLFTQTGNLLPEDGLEISLPRLILGVARPVSLGKQFNFLGTLDLETTFDGKRNTLIQTNVFSVDPRVGLEVGYKEMVYLRGGVNQIQQIKDFDHSRSWIFQPSAGIGLVIKELKIDYAFTDIGDQSAGLYSHVFSIIVDFHKDEK